MYRVILIILFVCACSPAPVSYERYDTDTEASDKLTIRNEF